MDKIISDYMANLGKKGGGSTSVNKQNASKLNGQNGWKPHFIKIKHFLEIFPYELTDNEYQDKFDLEINGKKTTYNPDYYCPTLDSYIEVTTSRGNISQQGKKWKQSIKNGHKLLIFWWEGNNITSQFL